MKVAITDLKSLPHICGIYKVSNAMGCIIYIGQAKNIHARWNSGHHKLGEIICEYGINVYIEWLEIPEWLLNRAENVAVSFYKPSLNLKNPPIV